MKTAFSTIGCPGWTWNEIFATAKDMGLDGIEIRGIGPEIYAPRAEPFSEKNRAATLERLRKANVAISMVTSGACLGMGGDIAAHLAEAKSYVDFAGEVGAPYVRVMISDTPEGYPDEDVEAAAGYYQSLCDYAKGTGVDVLIETNGKLADSKVMRQFLDSVDADNKGVLWDIHHPYRYLGEKPWYTYENIGEYVRYIHVKDSVGTPEKVEYRMMGYGDVPIFDTLKILHDHGYEGYVSLEWVKRWNPDLQEPGVVFYHYANYIRFLMNQL